MHSHRINVCHLASGDLWAGAEVQLTTLVSQIIKDPALDVSAVILNEGRLAAELRRRGVHVTVLDETKLNSFRIFKQLLTFLRTKPINILHTHRYKENVLGSIAAHFTGTPYVVRTVHGLHEHFTPLKHLKMLIYSRLNDLTARYCTHRIIAVSSDIRNELRNTYGSDKIVCIHNAIDVKQIRASTNAVAKKEELRIPNTDRVIGTIARLTPIKGIAHFLEAARTISEQRPDVIFLIVGDGPLRHSLELLSTALSIQKHVRFLGYREDIYDLINIMDIVVLSSLHEGIPSVLLEALTMRKSIVATRVGGIPEVVTDGAGAILIEPSNPAQLAAACLKLLDSSTQGDEFTTKHRDQIVQRFSSEVSSEKVIALYKAAMTLRT